MGGEKGGSKSSGFFHLFDWNRKSRKKLFSISPEGTKQGKRSTDNLPATQLRLIDDDEVFAVPSIKGSSDYSCASSVTDDDGNGTRAPGVVARLMGLDSMPTSGAPEPYSTPFFDARSFRYNQSQRSPDFYTNENFNYVPHKAEGYFRKPMESRSQKMPSSPIERFQREILPPRLGKSLPLNHHKLLSPNKNLSFTSAKNATEIMEAAAKIIEPGLQMHPSTKGKIGSPSIPIRVREPKNSMSTTERTTRLLQLSRGQVELDDSQYSRGQSRNWNRAEDIVIVRSSPDPYEINGAGARDKGKSISLAVQAKVNVQKREGLGSSSRNTIVQKEHDDYKGNQPFRTQANNQKNKSQQKPSAASVSGVLRQNNQKQNCQVSKSKLGLKQSSQQHGRKIASADPSSGKNKNANKFSGTSRNNCRKITGLDMEGSSSSNKDFPQKKRLIEGGFNSEKNLPTYGGLMKRHEAQVKSDMVIDEHTKRSEENRNTTDIISFTFTSPLIKTFGASQSGSLAVDKWDKEKCSCLENNFSGVNKSLSSPGLDILGGDALSHLLERKLRELTSPTEPSCDLTRTTKFTASAPIPQALKSSSYGLNTPTAQHKDFQPRQLKDRPGIVVNSGISSANYQVIGMNNKLLAVEAENDQSSNNNLCIEEHNHQSPLSVFDASFSSESWQLSESPGSTYGSDLCPSSVNAQNIADLHSSSKSVEAEPELSDSASSIAKDPQEGTADPMRPNEQELKYVRKMLCNKGLTSENIGSYYLTSVAENFEGNNRFVQEELVGDKARNKLLEDCVQECLELKHDHYFKAGYEAWNKGMMLTRRKDMAQEVYDEISGWKSMSSWIVDELVANDMSTHLGSWVDFEIEAFETGKQIQRQILSSLVDEVFAEFHIK
ncbi:uncharacterized protein LOC141832235 [Curcuma longa]|uniref:uncharacterized protein LOC141832235 n=1 Tax=Curcuma longa TaxID=136217 RepID=UPI003D9DD2DF